jgi:hypothetical protein
MYLVSFNHYILGICKADSTLSIMLNDIVFNLDVVGIAQCNGTASQRNIIKSEGRIR